MYPWVEPLAHSAMDTYNCVVGSCYDASYSAWTFALILKGTFLLLVFSRWIAPFILRHVSRHVRVRSVSFRSIKGLYIRAGNFTLRVERIGISFHRRTEVDSARFSIQVRGLKLEIYPATESAPSSSPSKLPSKFIRLMKHLADFVAKLNLLGTLYFSISWWIRPVFRLFVVSFSRLLIRVVPALAQILDFSMDTASIQLIALPGLELCVSGVHLSTKVTFTQLEDFISPSYSRISGKGNEATTMQSSGWSANWSARFKDSVNRTWDKVWGQTEGFASVALRIERVMAIPPQRLRKANAATTFSSLFDVKSPSHIEVSARFHPREGRVDEKSVRCSFHLSAVEIAGEAVKVVLEELEALSPKAPPPFAAIQIHGSQVSDGVVQPPVMSRLKTVMIANRFRRNLKATVSRRGRRRRLQYLFSLMDQIDFQVSGISMSYELKSPSEDLPLWKLLLSNELLRVRCSKSSSENSAMHHQWLGSERNHSEVSHVKKPTSIALKSALTQCYLLRSDERPAFALPMIQLKSFETTSLLLNWPELDRSSDPFARGDPNSARLVLQCNVGSIGTAIDIEGINQLLYHVAQSKNATEPKAAPSNFQLPSIHFGLHVEEISCRMWADRRLTDRASSICAQTAGINLDGDIAYVTEWESSRRGFLAKKSRQALLIAEVMGQAVILPIFIWALPPSGSQMKRQSHSVGSSTPTNHLHEVAPIVSIATIDAPFDGTVIAVPAVTEDDEDTTPIIDLSSMLLNCRVVTDDIAIDLWNRDSTLVLVSLLGRLVFPGTKPRPASATHIQCFVAHIAASTLTVYVTGADLNPSCSLDLSRGVYLKTSLIIDICNTFGPILGLHAKRITGAAHSRQRLGITEDLMLNAIASAKDNVSQRTTRITGRSTLIRRAISTNYDADVMHAEAWDKGFRDSDPGAVALEIPSCSIRMVSQTPFQRGIMHSSQRTSEVFIDIPKMQVRFELLTAYSILLAITTLRSFTRSSGSQPAKQLKPQSPTPSFRVRLGQMQVFCSMPLQQKLFLDLQSIEGVVKPDTSLMTFKSLLAYIPSPSFDGEWEKLGAISAFKLEHKPADKPDIALLICTETFHFRIPWKYLVADLILDISVTIKLLRHLLHITSAHQYAPFAQPIPEEAKRVPAMSIEVACVCLEAADDPFEAKLGLLWRAGIDAHRTRIQRDRGFEAKVDALAGAKVDAENTSQIPKDRFAFGPEQSVSIDEARRRLLAVHSASWLVAHRNALEFQVHREEGVRKDLWGSVNRVVGDTSIHIKIRPAQTLAPLVRVVLKGLDLQLHSPAAQDRGIVDFLSEFDDSMPKNMGFTLLIPFHLQLKSSAVNLSIRDYPLPVLNICPVTASDNAALFFDGDVVIAEQIGPSSSVFWKECPVVEENADLLGAPPFFISVPKTAMPVKIYSQAAVKVSSPNPVDFTWGVSYMPAIQSIAKVIDGLTNPPPDPSPAIGFWDKMRLVLHCQVTISFDADVHLNLKGSRDPYQLDGDGAGFALRWLGQPRLALGTSNDERELVQLSSDSMLVVIPDFSHYLNSSAVDIIVHPERNRRDQPQATNVQKVVATFTNGIHMGLGFVFERACRDECHSCSGSPFERKCRFFSFVPHHQVELRAMSKSDVDSYQGFRSDFVHLSVSLSSASDRDSGTTLDGFSSVHLSALTFAHFWCWLKLFDSSMSLPIGQGTLYPRARPPSPKFGKHIGTIKYRISVSHLFISHIYRVDTVEAWTAGETHMVGIKLQVSKFQADMHQREEELLTTLHSEGTPVKVRHKVLNAAEVVIHGITLRTMYSVFKDPHKLMVSLPKEPSPAYQKPWLNASLLNLDSEWASFDDWVELDEHCKKDIDIYYAEVGQCPRFIYFKSQQSRSPGVSNLAMSRFDGEHTHRCVIGREPSIHQVQIELSKARLAQLQTSLAKCHPNAAAVECTEYSKERSGLERQAEHVSRYIAHLERADGVGDSEDDCNPYTMSSESLSAADFINVYQVHSPLITINNVTRNILMQYYYASRSRRGYEYHMAARAVKFIKDQAQTGQANQDGRDNTKRSWNPAVGAQVAAQVIRKMLVRDDPSKPEEEDDGMLLFDQSTAASRVVDPSVGWSPQNTSINKGHHCVLLKPQVVLHSERSDDSVLILASATASLRSFTVVDNANASDPVNGYIMTRTYSNLDGLQIFAPTGANAGLKWNQQSVPLEVLVDYRCESVEFDRLVPQTNASLQYDKFNRLRLRNKASSLVHGDVDDDRHLTEHLRNHTDLIAVNVPRLSVTADCKHFGSISNVVTDLLLYSDPIYQRRAEELETYVILYDFHDLQEAASVVLGYQRRIRDLMSSVASLRQSSEPEKAASPITDLKAQILLASEELHVIFESIKLAQEKVHGEQQDQQMALRLLATSSEISWQMMEGPVALLAKVAIRDIGFSWLSRQDSSTVNKLVIRDFQAWDGAQDAIWPEILSKYKEPGNHTLVKRGIFAEADWCVLPPVGGIAIYESFTMELHPIRLQIHTSLGARIMEYVWPARDSKQGGGAALDLSSDVSLTAEGNHRQIALQAESAVWEVTPPNIPSTRRDTKPAKAAQDRLHGQDAVTPGRPTSANGNEGDVVPATVVRQKSDHDALLMRGRSSQKTFVLVRVGSIHLLLSIMKEDSFLCREARIRTRELIYKNQTWSFEELASQFIPSDPSWKGWIKMALQQPLLPVFPVAKELISKTKWGARTTKTLEEGPITWANLQSAVSEGSPKKAVSRSGKRSRTLSRHSRRISKEGAEVDEVTDLDTTEVVESPRVLRKSQRRPRDP